MDIYRIRHNNDILATAKDSRLRDKKYWRWHDITFSFIYQTPNHL